MRIDVVGNDVGRLVNDDGLDDGDTLGLADGVLVGDCDGGALGDDDGTLDRDIGPDV